MGSLMSGWSCQVHDPKKVKHMRNKSMTLEEIDTFWTTQKKTQVQDPDHMMMKSIVSSSPSSSSSSSSLPTTPYSTSSYTLLADHDYNNTADSKVFSRSASMPPMDQLASCKQPFSRDHHHYLDDNIPSKKTNCWWMASKWAFLNEPPVLINEPPQKVRRHAPYNYTTEPAADYMSQREATKG